MADEKILTINLPNIITITAMWLVGVVVVVVVMFGAGRIMGSGSSK